MEKKRMAQINLFRDFCLLDVARLMEYLRPIEDCRHITLCMILRWVEFPKLLEIKVVNALVIPLILQTTIIYGVDYHQVNCAFVCHINRIKCIFFICFFLYIIGLALSRLSVSKKVDTLSLIMALTLKCNCWDPETHLLVFDVRFSTWRFS